jgi:hypothetical protein
MRHQEANNRCGDEDGRILAWAGTGSIIKVETTPNFSSDFHRRWLTAKGDRELNRRVRRERRRTTKRINRKVRKGKSKTKPTTGDAEKIKIKSTAERRGSSAA